MSLTPGLDRYDSEGWYKYFWTEIANSLYSVTFNHFHVYIIFHGITSLSLNWHIGLTQAYTQQKAWFFCIHTAWRARGVICSSTDGYSTLSVVGYRTPVCSQRWIGIFTKKKQYERKATTYIQLHTLSLDNHIHFPTVTIMQWKRGNGVGGVWVIAALMVG